MTRDDVRAYYQGCGDREWARLATAEGSVEFAVNTHAIAAYLPPGVRVLDMGGDPGPKGSMMIHRLHYLLLALAVGAALGSAATLSSLAFAGGVPQQHAGVGRNTLLVIVQQGVRSTQVQIGAGHDEIVAVHGNRVPRVLIGGLTVPCCDFGGLAPAPCGRYVAFSQEATAGVHPGRQTAGLWIVTSAGAKLHRLLFPPAPTRLGVSLGIGPVAWSPDGYTLAYAVNGNDVPRSTRGLGIWLTHYDTPQPRLAVTLAQLYRPLPASAGPFQDIALAITALSWAPDGRTLAVSFQYPVTGANGFTTMVVAINTVSGRTRALITGSGTAGGDAAFAPTGSRLAYVTGGVKGTALWVADAQGRRSHMLVSTSERISSPTWSPDGRTIAYLTGQLEGQGTAIHTVDVSTDHNWTELRANEPGLPAAGYFVRLAWMHQCALGR